MRNIPAVIFTVACAAVALAGCGGTPPPAHHSAASTATAAAVATPGPSSGGSCSQQFLAWAHSGGQAHMGRVARLLTRVGTDDHKVARDIKEGRQAAELHDDLNLDVAAGFLKAVAGLALAHPPPSCDSAIADGYSAAMRHFAHVYADVKANDPVAESADLRAGTTAIDRAAKAINSLS